MALRLYSISSQTWPLEVFIRNLDFPNCNSCAKFQIKSNFPVGIYSLLLGFRNKFI